MAKHPESEDDIKAPPPQKRPKQRELDGFEQIEDPELREAVETYVDARDERMARTEAEVEAKKALLGMMKAKKKTRLSVDEYLVEIVHEEETVKVRRHKPKKAEKE